MAHWPKFYVEARIQWFSSVIWPRKFYRSCMPRLGFKFFLAAPNLVIFYLTAFPPTPQTQALESQQRAG